MSLSILGLGAGCADEVASPDGSAAPDPSDPSDPPGPKVIEGDCGLIDVACPAERPHPGAPCQGDLSCGFQENSALWTATCEREQWSLSASCTEMTLGGACFLPSDAETCEGPFEGQSTGTIEVGVPSTEGAFRPFEGGEMASVEFGGQGSAMLWYRVQVDGEDLPSCVRATATMESEAFYDPGTVVRDVVLRCGSSLDMFTIVPYGDCDGGTEPVPVDLTVAIQGVGEVTYSLMIPADSLCGGFG